MPRPSRSAVRSRRDCTVGRPGHFAFSFSSRCRVRPGRSALPAVFLILGLIPAGCSPNGENGIREPAYIFGGRGKEPGSFIKPRAIGANHRGEVFVVDRGGTIQKFDREGKHLLSWELEMTEYGYPTGLGCDPEGDLWVADTHNSRILHYSSDGNLLGSFGEYGENIGEFVFPTDVLVSGDGFLYVTNYGAVGRDRIMKFRTNGSFVEEWGATGSGPGELQRGMGLCRDRNGNIWVADSCNHRLQCFAPDGELVRIVSEGEDGEPLFSYPYDVDLDDGGNLVVCDYNNHRVHRVTPEGRSIEAWGRAGRLPGEFNHPWGLAVLADRVYVVDAQNDRIQVFTL